jgi:hypothetical protein
VYVDEAKEKMGVQTRVMYGWGNNASSIASFSPLLILCDVHSPSETFSFLPYELQILSSLITSRYTLRQKITIPSYPFEPRLLRNQATVICARRTNTFANMDTNDGADTVFHPEFTDTPEFTNSLHRPVFSLVFCYSARICC